MNKTTAMGSTLINLGEESFSINELLLSHAKLISSIVYKDYRAKYIGQDECFQELCTAFIELAPTYRYTPKTTFTTYISTCLRNKLLRFIKEEMAKSKRIINLDDCEDILPQYDNNYFTTDTLTNFFNEFIQINTSKNNKQNIVAKLFYINGLTHNEIAQQCDMCRQNVQQRLALFNKKFYIYLGERGGITQ